LPYGKVDVVVGRGPPVMKRWFKNPEAMTKAVGAYGWLDTVDLGRINPVTGDPIGQDMPKILFY
jgi:long-subunit acyl-CoA synthetase (AMP-forming)